MSGTVSRTALAAAPTSLERWSELPENIQASVIAELNLPDCVRAALADRHLDYLVQSDSRWPKLLLGTERQGPLPERPWQAVGVLLAPYKRNKHLKDLVRTCAERGIPLNEDSLFDAGLECWAKREMRAGNSAATEAARQIRQVHASKAPSLSLAGLHIRTLPNEFGHLASLRRLYLSWKNLTGLPGVLGTLTGLQELYLSHCNLRPELLEFRNLNLERLVTHSGPPLESLERVL